MNGKSRREYLEAIYTRYRQAELTEKQMILDEFCRNTGYHRKYAIRLLNSPPPGPEVGASSSETPGTELQHRSGQYPGRGLGGSWLPLCRAAEGLVAPLDAVGPETLSA